MRDFLLSLGSHFMGHRGSISKKVSKTLEIVLSLVVAIVSLGYINHLLLLLFPGYPLISFCLSMVVLLMVIPFEYININIQNSSVKIDSVKPAFFTQYPVISQLLMFISSVMGALQYLIRNYTLVANFAITNTGKTVIKGLKTIGYTGMSGARLATFGGIVGFFSHLLLSYGKWDDYLELSIDAPYAKKIALILWCLVGVLLGCLVPFSVYKTVLPVLCVGMIVYQLDSYNYLSSVKRISLPQSMKSDLYDMWKQSLIFTLPIAASLYGLIDFFNTWIIFVRLGWMNGYALELAIIVGAVSMSNQIFLWGYNTVKSVLYVDAEERPVSKNNGFVSYYYADPSVRSAFSVLRETLMCGVDILSNYLTISLICDLALLMFGIPVRLAFLNLCTACFAINKIVILMFQTSHENIEYTESIEYKETNLANFCRGMFKLNPQKGLKIR